MKARITTVDGLAASGKGAVTLEVAVALEALGHRTLILPSGDLYRALGLLALAVSGYDEAEAKKLSPAHIVKLGQSHAVDLAGSTLYMDGEPADKTSIKPKEVAEMASWVGQFREVRDFVNVILRREAKNFSGEFIILEGRDGSFVFPTQASLRYYFHVSPEVAVERLKAAGRAATIEETERRNERERTRAVDPLIIAPDAKYIDTDHRSILDISSEVLKDMLALVE